MRSRFDEELELLNQELTRMGMLCEYAIQKSSDALFSHETDLASEMADTLEEINEKDREIENLCLRLLLRQQPVASDLRVISSAMKMITDMRRVAAQAGDIAEIVSMGSVREIPGNLPLKHMAESVTGMVSKSIDAFVRKDLSTARAVIASDDVVDHDFNQVKKRLVSLIQRIPSGKENDRGTDSCDRIEKEEQEAESILDLLMIAKYLERIGDHAVRIAGWVTFAITGIREGK